MVISLALPSLNNRQGIVHWSCNLHGERLAGAHKYEQFTMSGKAQPAL